MGLFFLIGVSWIDANRVMAGPKVSPPADPRLSGGVLGGGDTTCMKSGKYWVHEEHPGPMQTR